MPVNIINQIDSLTVATDTIEHMSHLAVPPVGDALAGCFAVVQRPLDGNIIDLEGRQSAVELITVGPDNKQLLHVRRCEQSESGWRSDAIALPAVRADGQSITGDIEQIEAFYQQGRIYAMVHFPAPGKEADLSVVVPMMFDEKNGGWQEMALQGDTANALYSTRQTSVYRTPNGFHFFYGVSTAYEHPQFFVVFETGTAGVWDAVNERVPSADATYRLLPGSSQDRYGHTLLRMDSEGMHSQAFYLEEDRNGPYLEWDSVSASSTLGGGELNAANVYPFPSRLDTDSLIIRSSNGELTYVAGYQDDALRHLPLSGGNGQPAQIESVAIGRDRFDRAIVFAASARDRRLWILRQSGIDNNGDLTFDNWVCLGNPVATMGCPRAMLDGAELFLVDSRNRALQHMRQDAETTLWHTSNVAVAKSGKAQHGTVHAVDVRTLDHQGVMVPNAALEIRSSHATNFAVNGVGRHCNAETWLKVNADIGGKLTLHLPADGLNAPEVDIRVPATGKVINVRPDEKVSRRLRGKDPRVTVDAKNLRKAGLIPNSMNGADANAVAAMVRSLGRSADRAENPPDKAHAQADRFTIEAGGSIKQTQVSAGSASGPVTHAATLPQQLPTVGEQIGDFLGDVLNFLEHAWEDVKKFVVTVADGVTRLIITIGDAVTELIVDTAQGIAQAFESLFSSIAQFFKDAVETIVDVVESIVNFVRALFGWEDILLTNDVIKHSALSTLDSVEEFLGVTMVDWINAATDGIKGQIDEMFDQLESVVKPIDPRNAQDDMAANDPTGTAKHLQSVRDDNTVATEMVSNQSQRSPDAANTVEKAGNFPGKTDPFQAFLDAMGESAKKNFEEKLGSVLNNFKPQSLDEFFQDGIVIALRAVRTVLLFAIDLGSQLVQLGVRLAGAVIKMLRDLLDTDLNIPLVSDFFEKHSNGRRLKILDLGTLLIALPATIIYKLVMGGKDMAAPFTGQQVRDLKQHNWGDLLDALAVVNSGGRFGRHQKHQGVGAMVNWQHLHNPVPHETTEELALEIKQGILTAQRNAWKGIYAAAEFFRPLLPVFAVLQGIFSIIQGITNSLKHMVDSKAVTGAGTSILSTIGYIGKACAIALMIPELVVLAADVLGQTEHVRHTLNHDDKLPVPPEEGDSMPFLLGAVSLLLTITMLALGKLKVATAVLINKIASVIGAILLGGITIYTVVLLARNGSVRGTGEAETVQHTFEQTASMMAAIPNLFSWIILAAPVAGEPGGSLMVGGLIAVEVLCGLIAGIALILSVAIPAAMQD